MRVIDEEYDGDYEDVHLRSLLAERHLKFAGDEDYLSSVVEVDGLVERSYKASVNERRALFDSPEQVGPLDMAGIIGMNVAKTQYILQDLSFEDSVLRERAPVLSDAYFECSLFELLVYQNRQLADSGRVYVCNTCLFFALENWPSAVDQIWSKWLESCSS